MKINWNNKYATIAIYAFLVICGSILLYLGIARFTEIKSGINDFIGTLQPFIIGTALAYLLNFILKFYEKNILSYKWFNNLNKTAKRAVGIVFTYITAILITYLFIQFVLPQLIDSVVGLVNNIPQYVNDVSKYTNELIGNVNLQPEYITLINEKLGEAINYIITTISNLLPVIANFVISTTSSVLNIIIGIIVSIYILIDKEKFAQVIINILANAIKYNNGNNEIYISSFKKDDNIVISIKDYGVGIAKSEQKNIFERFYRVDKSRGANEKGMGVGLTIAKSIVNAHGGEIKVYSEINKGSEFIITLPNEG